MTPIPVKRARFDAFDEHERGVMQHALLALAVDIRDEAVAEDIDSRSLGAAGATFLHASLLAYELMDLAGEEHPSVESVELMAACIAEGDAPLADKMAREAIDAELDPTPSVQDYAELDAERGS